MKAALHLLVPGPINRPTGGSRYDARVAEELRAMHWTVTVHELPGAFPATDAKARDALHATLAALPDGSRAIIDGLALGDSPDIVAAHVARLRLLALVHHPLGDETGLDPALRERFLVREARALAGCAGVIVTSRHTRRRVAELGVPDTCIRVVVPGTDPAPPARGPDPGEPPMLLCVGSVIPRKGQDVLVAALERLRDTPWQCLIAGSTAADPPFAAALHNRIDDAGLTGRITLAGECGPARLDRAYDRSTLFVLPSHYEGYGMVLAEALARGLPVVSTTGGAIPDTVPETAGRLVPPGDTTALAGAITTLLHDHGARARAARAARHCAGSLPNWTETATVFARAVEDLS
ncbi:glycosyltransferase family 4 protein [Aquisalimonas asiatica]|uniref:Glycosyltransferase involved in cell wall bisynthesis n=1 Tax=Aquisalimonas asiatica TaxID=406100 RepID=A0A1H8TJR7_9GAMM|nr:glycosyltransferase family 4 protein [Aquisalimonas asiatica]SEO91071.1 Glycosyltransferase involved in cell wall bisynthesis [Aquisalimonas asiatica]